MTYVSENIIPGNMGKTFSIGINNPEELARVLERLMDLEGVKDVLFNDAVYPHEITIHTYKPVSIKQIQKAVNVIGFHAVSKTFYI